MKKQDRKIVSRREFLKVSAVLGSTLATSPTLLASTTPATNKNLVLIFLRGGCDGLSAVMPHNAAVYKKLKEKRPNILYPVANNSNDNFFGINTDLTDLIQLYNKGNMAIIHGTGGKNETTSHFAQMDYIESGSSKKILGEGFLARFAKHLNSETFALEPILPRSLRSSDKFALQFTSKAELASIRKQPQQQIRIDRSTFLSTLFSGGTLNLIRRKADTLELQQSTVNRNLASKVDLNSSYASKDIQLLAEMISKGNSGVYSLSSGGWDHHRALKDVFVNKSNALFSDLNKLQEDLKANKKWANTTIVVMSEFGRRIGENGSNGCDHGRGGVAYVLGGRVTSKKIFRNKNYDKDLTTAINKSEATPKECLPVSTDIRLVFAEIFNKVYGINTEDALNQIFSNDSDRTISDPVPKVTSDYLGFIS